jgi:hypothetical protein
MQVNSFQIIIEFELDQQIVFSLGQQLKELQKALNGKLSILNTPRMAAPPTPRALIKSADTILTISLDRLEITTTPLQHIMNNYESCVKFFKSRIESILKILRIEDLNYKSLGVISDIQFPYNEENISGIKVIEPIFDRLINIQRKERDLASFQLLFGFMEKNFYTNYIISGYEIKNIQIPSSPPQNNVGFVAIDTKSIPISESGIGIKIDINNKNK